MGLSDEGMASGAEARFVGAFVGTEVPASLEARGARYARLAALKRGHYKGWAEACCGKPAATGPRLHCHVALARRGYEVAVVVGGGGVEWR
jgi:hypothetical protein